MNKCSYVNRIKPYTREDKQKQQDCEYNKEKYKLKSKGEVLL